VSHGASTISAMPVTETPEVLLFIVDAGGGHRAAANALLAAAELRSVPWRFRVVSLQEVLAPLDFTRRITGLSMEDTYNAMVRRRQTRFLVPMLRMLQWGIEGLRPTLARRVTAYLKENRPPAAVVSLLPNFNRVLEEGVRQAHPGVPFMVVLTDFADFPPRFWMQPGPDRVVVASDHAVEQARELGFPSARVSRTSGMLLHPKFYGLDRGEARARVRQELGIPAGAFAVLIVFGGKGTPEIRPLSEALLREGPDWHVVAICGDNPRLQESMDSLAARSGGRLHPLGFTSRVPDYLAACDVLLSKPGPGTLAEAFHSRIPIVVPCNGHTIPQERYNARYLEKQGLGVVVGHWRQMPAAVAALAADAERRQLLLRNLAALPPNRAVFEVLELFEAVLMGSAAPAVPSPATG